MDFGNAVLAMAAVVQAIAAVAIWWLTRRLAHTADGALEASKQQAAAAHEAMEAARLQAESASRAVEAAKDQAESAARTIREMRRQGQLARVPLLDLERPSGQLDNKGSFLTSFRVWNKSSDPALGVRISARGEHGKGDPELNERIFAPEIPVLEPNGDRRIDAESQAFQNATLSDAEIDRFVMADKSPPRYSNDWILVRVRYRSVLGALVEQEYEWNANFADQLRDGVWTLLRMAIMPNADDAEEIRYKLG